MVSQNAVIAALSSTALISLAPNLLLFCFPHFASGEGHSSPSLSLGQALAAGGLLGDVFLHVVPHSGGDHNVGLWILLGFSVFLLTDMLMRSFGGGHSHSHDHSDPVKSCKVQQENSTSTVLLNLTADSLHNVSRVACHAQECRRAFDSIHWMPVLSHFCDGNRTTKLNTFSSRMDSPLVPRFLATRAATVCSSW